MLFDDELIRVEKPNIKKPGDFVFNSNFKIFNHFLFMEMQQFYYDNKIVKLHLRDHCFGVVGMLVGLTLAFMFLFQILPMGFVVELRSIKTPMQLFCLCRERNVCGYLLFFATLVESQNFSDFE
jgi:cytochrome c oxidase cbb3-type subunit I/II